MGYQIIWQTPGIIRRFFAHVDSNDLLQAGVATQGDIRFDDLRYVIDDFLAVTSISVAASDVDEIAAIDAAASKINSKIMMAVVAIDPQIVALANHYATSPMNVYPTCIFSTRAAAAAWLALPPTAA